MPPFHSLASTRSRLALAAEAMGALVVFLARVFLPEGRSRR
jgi:hypothetical protein